MVGIPKKWYMIDLADAKDMEINITSIKSIKKFLKKTRPQSVLHLAGLSRPMIEHEKNINKSINLNIVFWNISQKALSLKNKYS